MITSFTLTGSLTTKFCETATVPPENVLRFLKFVTVATNAQFPTQDVMFLFNMIVSKVL